MVSVSLRVWDDGADRRSLCAGLAGGDHSFSSHLQSLDKEDGLIAEIDFRKHHLRRYWNGRRMISESKRIVIKIA